MRYSVVIEQAVGNYSAHVPDLPGCIATGKTMSEVESEISEAIAVPPPASHVEYVEVAA
jgi:predicted RNase H-like HicB family nuclease